MDWRISMVSSTVNDTHFRNRVAPLLIIRIDKFILPIRFETGADPG
ncbi:MAG: hypothetical protein IPM85_15055 [Chitinophagaceae bacterium]|nr:hypothetical protein [Chitinophagaceae bacterium]